MDTSSHTDIEVLIVDAVKNGDVAILKEYIEKKVDIHNIKHYGKTLHK